MLERCKKMIWNKQKACGKLRFETEKQAQSEALKIWTRYRERVYVYWSGECGCYHLSTKGDE